MKFTSARQLKDWIKNKSKQTGTPANTLLQTYMMERFLERISLSEYKDNMVLKGGFLIASMIGIDKRSTKDMDTTMIGLYIDHNEIERIINKVISIDVNDDVSFIVIGIESIHEDSDYDDFRIMLKASFHTIRVDMKLDITVGDSIIPREINYQYKLMFDDRSISVMAYNLYTILAEKIETILSRNVTNTRGRDFYDSFTLLSLHKNSIIRSELLHAIRIKAENRKSLAVIDNYAKHLKDISESPEIENIWSSYKNNYPYAEGIAITDVVMQIAWVFEG